MGARLCYEQHELAPGVHQDVPHWHLGALPCACHNDPYNCQQGQALAQAIHDRKTAQGDD